MEGLTKQTTKRNRKERLEMARKNWLTVVMGIAVIGIATPAYAKHGADDPAGDDRGQDAKPHKLARHGGDDPAGDDRGQDAKPHKLTRHGGNDDPAGDDNGQDAKPHKLA
ncbi:MAG TPA: hypothetical protein VFP65_29145 [Anaeromyxobacteraceae bacterium]|nr:hypothetical protein [Anaeromyxobacteraceae bacterium]